MEVRFSFHRTIIAYLLYFFVVVQLSTANNVQQPQEDEDDFNLNVSVAQEQQQHGNDTSTPRLWIPTPPNYGNGSSSKEEAESQMIITSRHLETNNLLKNLSMFHQPSSSSEVRYKQPPSFGGEVDYAAAGVKRNGRLRKIIPMHLSTPEILLSPVYFTLRIFF